jgi:hypothetical protein
MFAELTGGTQSQGVIELAANWEPNAALTMTE